MLRLPQNTLVLLGVLEDRPVVVRKTLAALIDSESKVVVNADDRFQRYGVRTMAAGR